MNMNKGVYFSPLHRASPLVFETLQDHLEDDRLGKTKKATWPPGKGLHKESSSSLG